MDEQEQQAILRAVIAGYGSVARAAQQDLQSATSRAQQAACREVIALAQASALLYQQQLVGGAAPATIRAKQGDTIFGLAERHLGSALRYRAILAANGRTGLSLPPGTLLVLPAAGG